MTSVPLYLISPSPPFLPTSPLYPKLFLLNTSEIHPPTPAPYHILLGACLVSCLDQGNSNPQSLLTEALPLLSSPYNAVRESCWEKSPGESHVLLTILSPPPTYPLLDIPTPLGTFFYPFWHPRPAPALAPTVWIPPLGPHSKLYTFPLWLFVPLHMRYPCLSPLFIPAWKFYFPLRLFQSPPPRSLP